MTPRAWKRLFIRAGLWAAIAIGLLLLFLLGRATWSVYGKEREARTAHMDTAEQYADLEARQVALSKEIDSLNTQRGVEAEVRERYPVAKSGEEVIVLTDNPNETKASMEATSTAWERFLSWFSWF